MRPSLFYTILLLLLAGFGMQAYGACAPGLPAAWEECARVCERAMPEDRGQGCIDLECNPLLDKE